MLIIICTISTEYIFFDLLCFTHNKKSREGGSEHTLEVHSNLNNLDIATVNVLVMDILSVPQQVMEDRRLFTIFLQCNRYTKVIIELMKEHG